MANLSEIRTRIKSDLAINSTIHDTQIDDAIRSAIREYEQKPFWFLQATGTITLLSGNTSVALPSDFASLILARISINGYFRGQGQGFDKVGYKELLQLYQRSDTSGIPSTFAIYTGSLFSDREANANYTISIQYYKKDTTLPTDDTDTSVWFDDGQDAIRTLAMAMFKDEALEYQSAPNDWARADRYLRALRSRNSYYEMGDQ